MKQLILLFAVMFLSACPFCIAPCHARDYAASEQMFFQDIPVVLSASRLSQPLSETPNAVTVIDRAMISASGARTIPELFKLVPGMYVSYYRGSQPIVSYHGVTDQYARRMQVMIDGRSVYLPPASTVDWSNLPIAIGDVERIEVIRGPAAASHGANSLQGVISIMTKGANQVEGKTLSVTHGSKGVNDVSAHFGRRGETLDYRMTLAYTADNGYDDLTSAPNNLPVPVQAVSDLLHNSNDSNRARMVNFRANYYPNGVDSFDMQFGFSRDIQGVGFSDARGNPFHDLFSSNGFVQFDWVRQRDPASEARLRYYRIRQGQDETFVFARAPFTGHSAVQSLITTRDEIEAQHTVQIRDDNRFVYGGGWRRDRVDARGYTTGMSLLGLSPSYASLSVTDEYRVFAHDEWRISPKLLLNTGAMFESDRMGHQNLSPRIALNVHLAPSHTVRAGASVAYRTPALIEEKYPSVAPGVLFIPTPTVTSPGLLPERVLSEELGYLGKFNEGSLLLDARVFRDRIGNGIYPGPAGVFVNGMSSLYRGVETAIKWVIDSDRNLTFNYSRQRAHSNGPVLVAAGHAFLESKYPSNNDILAGSMPENSLSLLYSQRLGGGFSYSVSCYYQSALQPFDRDWFDHQLAQRRTDIRIAKAFRSNGLKGEISWVVQDVFDSNYTEYIASNLFNRRTWIKATLDF